MTGIVCDSADSREETTRSRSRYWSANEPEPKPVSGRSPTIRAPPRISLARPLEDSLSVGERVGLEPERPRREHEQRDRHGDEPAAHRHDRPGRQRSAASTASPTSSAAKLDSDSVSTSAAHSTASATATRVTSRRAGAHSSTPASTTITSARKRP